jgi:hypothetical protein
MMFNEQISKYSIALTTYEGTHRLPAQIFQQPDHLALRTADIGEFEHVVRSLNDNAEQMTCVEDEGRFRVDAKMLGSVSLGIYGRVKWLEIIEGDSSGIDHTEFFFPDFSKLRESFHRGRVDYEIDAVDERKVATVSFSQRGESFEVRITDTPVSEVVAREISNGEAYILAA